MWGSTQVCVLCVLVGSELTGHYRGAFVSSVPIGRLCDWTHKLWSEQTAV